MQSTIYLLEQQLQEAKGTIATLCDGSEPPDSRSEEADKDPDNSPTASSEIQPANDTDEPPKKGVTDVEMRLVENGEETNITDLGSNLEESDLSKDSALDLRRPAIQHKRPKAAQPESPSCEAKDSAAPSES